MGEPKLRLNPLIESVRNRTLLEKGTRVLLSVALSLPPPKIKTGKGRKPYDYRIVLVICILRILAGFRYADYETWLRADKRLIEMLCISRLPCKSTINNYTLKYFTLNFLSEFNRKLIDSWIKKPVDLLIDASGIRLVGRSIWFCIRTKKKILKKDCDKIHIAVSLCSLLIAEFRISNSKRNDSPFLRKLLKPFKKLGLIIADKGYTGKKNTNFVFDREGAFFSPFKTNVEPDYFSNWGKLYRLWKMFSVTCSGIYNQRSKVEAVFSALKNKYGDKLHSKKWYMRRREMAMRFIAYNVRIIVGIQISREKNIPLWVRA